MTAILAIFGAGGHGLVTADCAVAAGWEQVVFFDDRPDRDTAPWRLGGTSLELLSRLDTFAGVVAAIGDNDRRLQWYQRLSEAGASFATIVHPRAWISPNATVGPGSVLVAGAVVNYGARLGAACIVNTGATVDHDCRLGPGVHVSPGANLAGGVSVGGGSWIGAGAVVRDRVVIGERVRVGAGAVVIGDVADELTVVGCPARPHSGVAG